MILCCVRFEPQAYITPVELGRFCLCFRGDILGVSAILTQHDVLRLFIDAEWTIENVGRELDKSQQKTSVSGVTNAFKSIVQHPLCRGQVTSSSTSVRGGRVLT